MSTYDIKPDRFYDELQSDKEPSLPTHVYCAGFELGVWRAAALSSHLIEWLPDYALTEEELEFHHGNAYVKLREAAIRVYSSEKYKQRGEAGEISLHAICRDFFSTVPISPRVFYKSTSNDVVKAFDLVHARIEGEEIEIWLGESKLYSDPDQALSAAIKSIGDHIDAGFLKAQKLLLGPQVPKKTPEYGKIRALFRSQTSIDDLLNSAVFVVGIFCDAESLASVTSKSKEYVDAAVAESKILQEKLIGSGLCEKVRLLLVYVPLATKDRLSAEFDARLKGLQA